MKNKFTTTQMTKSILNIVYLLLGYTNYVNIVRSILRRVGLCIVTIVLCSFAILGL